MERGNCEDAAFPYTENTSREGSPFSAAPARLLFNNGLQCFRGCTALLSTVMGLFGQLLTACIWGFAVAIDTSISMIVFALEQWAEMGGVPARGMKGSFLQDTISCDLTSTPPV